MSNNDNKNSTEAFITWFFVFVAVSSILATVLCNIPKTPKERTPIKIEADKVGEAVGKTTGKFSRGFFRGFIFPNKEKEKDEAPKK